MGISRCRFHSTVVPGEIREALKGAVDLILPYKCAVCGSVSDTEDRFGGYDELYRSLYGGESGLHICGKCLSHIGLQDQTRRWFLCLSNPVENDPCPGLALYMPFPYQGTVGKCIPKIKFSKKTELARFFGCLLGSSLCGEDIKADIVVPVPLSAERLEERGFNQASEIAYPVAKLCGIPFVEDCLIRTRDTGRQTDMKDSFRRADNIKDAFAVSDKWDVTGLTVMVVDDVSTTGATLHETAKALYKAGASKVLCVALAGNRTVKNAEAF